MKYLIQFVFISIFFLTSCDDTITVIDVDGRIIPDSNVSFAEHIVPVLQAKCYACHDGSTNSHSPNMTLHTNIVDGRIVVPGDPETSVLIWAVERRSGFEMPPDNTRPPLTQNQVQGFKTWIEEGAKNN